MQYKSMGFLSTVMLGLVFSPVWALAVQCEDTEIRFSELQYMHVNIKSQGGSCTVLEKISTDDAARRSSLCRGGNFINPGNPQYSKLDPLGTRISTSKNYYFCIKGSSFNKKTICEGMVSSHPNLSTKWNPDGNQGDGNCTCGVKGSLRLTDCDDPSAIGNEDQKKCEDLKAKYTPSYNSKDSPAYCTCLSNSKVIDVAKGDTCDDTSTPATAVDANAVSQEVKDCIKEFEDKLNECKTMGETAKNKCDQNNQSNKSVDSAKSLIKTILDMVIQRSAGTGAQTQCAAASLMGTGTFKLMDQLKTTCEADITDCNNKCNELKGDVQIYCKGKSPQPPGEREPSADEIFLSQENARLKPIVEEGKKYCLVEAPKNKDLLKDALTAYDSAARSATTCACKLSANGTNCDSLPGPADCKINPSLPTCVGLGSGNCVLGSSDYALPKCQCLQDPSLSFCHASPGKVPFAFAGDLKAIQSGGGVFAGGGGTGGGDGMDLGGLNQQDARSDSKAGPQVDAPGFGVNNSGGGGGGGGSGGGGGDGAGAAAEAGGEPSEKSLGIMGMVKNAVGGMFSGKPSAAGSGKGSGKGSPGYDVEKWRPRGLASTGCNVSQIRCKNEDIFSIVNKRYLNNEMSFIQNP